MTPAGSGREERGHLVHGVERGRRIGVRIERPPGTEPRPFAVLCHGFKGFMDWGFFPGLSRAVCDAGFVAVSLNASGSGVGDNPLEMDDEEAFFRDTYGRQLEDIAAVRELARSLDGVDPDREVLFGHSRGGGMAVLAAAETPPRALVLWAAIDAADRFDASMKAQWRAQGELHVPNGRTGQIHRLSIAALDELEADPARFDILAAAGRISVPLLALHGSDDPTVDPRAAERIAGAAPQGRAVILDGADHAMNARHPCPEFVDVDELAHAVDLSLDFMRAHALA